MPMRVHTQRKRHFHRYRVRSRLLGLLSLELGVSVDNLDAELLGALDNQSPLSGGHVMGDLRAVLSVVHEEKLELGNVVNLELVKSVRETVLGLFVAAIPYVDHGDTTAELTADAAIDTTGSAPRFLKDREEIVQRKRVSTCFVAVVYVHNYFDDMSHWVHRDDTYIYLHLRA